jgi:hypothetical protein
MRLQHAHESATVHELQTRPAERSGPVECLRCNKGGVAKPRYSYAQGYAGHANRVASEPESWLGVTSHPCPAHCPLN